MPNILSIAAGEIASQIDSRPDIGTLSGSSVGVVPRIYIDTIRDKANVVVKISNLIHSSTSSNKNDILELMASLQAMQSAAELLDQVLVMAASSSQNSTTSGVQQSQHITSGKSWVTGTLIPWIKSLWGSAWSLVTMLSTPTEWKLKGELGTGVLGLAKSSIEIKFG